MVFWQKKKFFDGTGFKKDSSFRTQFFNGTALQPAPVNDELFFLDTVLEFADDDGEGK